MKKQDRGEKMKEGPILVWHVEESFVVAAVEPWLVDVELGAEMVEDVVGWGVETTSGGEVEVGSHEEIGEVLGVNLAGDGGMVASGAGVLENGARVGGVDPDELEDGIAEDGIGCAEVGEGNVGFGGEEDAGEVEGSVKLFCATDSNDGSGMEGVQREHIVVGRGWGAGGAKGADVNQRALERAIRTFFHHLAGDG
jgi:hypothetical protein